MSRTAFLVCEELNAQERRLTQLLDFFGVSWERVGPGALWNPPRAAQDGDGYCVFSAMDLLGRAVEPRGDIGRSTPLLTGADSTYFFGGTHSAATCFALQWLTQCPSARINLIQGRETFWSVANNRAEICGPMSGLQVGVSSTNAFSAMEVPNPGRDFNPVISGKEGHLFASLDLDGVPCFLSSCSDLIDISGPVEKGFFDVRDYFGAAVPVVMYLHSQFGAQVPSAAENGACLVVDDLVLRPQYGFLNFQHIAALTVEHQFSCTVAFIPWNQRRSRPSVIELFKRHTDRLSLCVHGCDHTAGEFGTRSSETLNAQTKLAIQRMERHQQITGLQYEPLMVFPQGAFSVEAPAVLKHNGFIAAANTEVSPVNSSDRTAIREVWKTATMHYTDFPIYTRRYPFHGLCNFAFDILLGKPALIVTHHVDFHDNAQELVHFIDQLNALPTPLTWRPLREVIRRAYRQRLRNDRVFQVIMFGNEILVENPSSDVRHFIVEKPEHKPEGVERIEADGRIVSFLQDQDQLRFEFDVAPHQNALVRVGYKDIYGDAQPKRSVRGEFKLMARRYLSELRDEAHARAPWLLACAGWARHRLRLRR